MSFNGTHFEGSIITTAAAQGSQLLVRLDSKLEVKLDNTTVLWAGVDHVPLGLPVDVAMCLTQCFSLPLPLPPSP